jgi:hypothetical protein
MSTFLFSGSNWFQRLNTLIISISYWKIYQTPPITSWYTSRLLVSTKCLRKLITGSNRVNPNRTVKEQSHLTMECLAAMLWWAALVTVLSWALLKNQPNVTCSTLTADRLIQPMTRSRWAKWFMNNKSTISRHFRSFALNWSIYSTLFKPLILSGKWLITFRSFWRRISVKQTNWLNVSINSISINSWQLVRTRSTMRWLTPSNTSWHTSHLHL